MELPRRIMDGGAGAWEKSVISSAALDAPSPEFRRNLAQKLGVTLGAAGVAATTTSTAKAVGGALWLKWMGVGFAVGVVGLGAASYATSPTSPTPSAPAVVRVAATTVPPRSALVPTLTASPVPSDSTAPAVVASTNLPLEPASAPRSGAVNGAPPPSAAVATGPLGTASFAPAGPSELAAETAAIQAVRASLAAHQASRALEQIDRYEQSYPAGLFALEAEVLRIDANSQLGSSGTVKQLAERFLSAHPDSPYARHVRTLLEQGTNR